MTGTPNGSPLGQASPSPQAYAPEALYPIPRALARAELAIGSRLPFSGVDIWNAYELSWLDAKGKPVAALGELVFPATSPNLIESKSLKLYLTSLNQVSFPTLDAVREVLQGDVSRAAQAEVTVKLTTAEELSASAPATFPGTCLDALPIDVRNYQVDPALLRGRAGKPVSEALHTHLFKSNCPVTGQPDWASVLVGYRGPPIDHAALLEYLISYRNSVGFHEHCVERIFVDILERCAPQALTIYARYTRRGGLDINPFRSNFEPAPANLRLPRQ